MQTRCNVFILAHCALRTSKWGLFLDCDIWILMRTFHPPVADYRFLFLFPFSFYLIFSSFPFSILPSFISFQSLSFSPFLLDSSFSSYSSATRETIVLFSVGIHLGAWQQSPDFTTLVAIPKMDSSLADARKIFL